MIPKLPKTLNPKRLNFTYETLSAEWPKTPGPTESYVVYVLVCYSFESRAVRGP